MKIRTAIITSLVVITTASVALADKDDTATDIFNYGATLFEEGKYLEAALAFREADQLNPSWKVRYYLGKSEELAGRNGLAIEAYESYLNEGKDNVPQDRQTEIESKLAKLKKEIAYITAEGPEGAVILVDDMKRAVLPLETPLVITANTDHRIKMTFDEQVISEGPLKLESGHTIQIRPTAKNTDVDADDDSPSMMTPDEFNKKNRTLTTVGWSLVGAGGGLLAGGLIVGGVALAKNKNLEDSCPDGICPEEHWSENDKAQSLGIAANVMLVIGVAAGITGGILLIAAKKQKKKRKLSLSGALGPQWAGFTLQGRF